MEVAAITGRAREVSVRTIAFADPSWEPVFDELIKLTQRTELIIELTGTDVKTTKLKDAVTKRLKDMEFHVSKPRGKRQSEVSKGFLKKPCEKHDSAYLVALYFGSRDVEHSDSQNLNLLMTLQKYIQVYRDYVRDIYGNIENANVTFETFVLLINILKRREKFSLVTCKECGSRQPTTKGDSMRLVCHVCKYHGMNPKAAREQLDAMIAKRAYERSSSGFLTSLQL